MNYGKPAFHALEVRPQTAERIDSQEIRYEYDDYKERDSQSERSEFGAVTRLKKGQNDPAGKDQLDNQSKIESFAGYKREEIRVENDQRKDRDYEDQTDHNIPDPASDT